MAIYEIEGQRFELPDDLSQDQLTESLTLLSEQIKPSAPDYGFEHINEQAASPFGAGDYTRAGIQGLSFGWGDEMEAAGMAFEDWISGKGSYSALYNGYHKAMNDRMARFSEENTKTAIGAELAGGLVTGATLFRAASSLPTLGRWLANAGKIKKASAIGAMEGAIYGAGSAEQGERLDGAFEGAAVGAVAAPAIGKAFNAAGDLALKGKTQIGRWLADTPETKAKRIVTDALTYAGDEEALLGRMIALGPDATLMDASPAIRTRLAHGAAQLDGPFHNAAVEMAEQRNQGQIQRLLDAAGSGLGKEGDFNLPQWTKGITEAQRQQAAPLYEQIYKMPFTASEGLTKAFDEVELLKPVLKKAADKFRLNEFGQEPDFGSIKVYDYVKRELDDMIGAAFRNGRKSEGADLLGVKRRLVQEMDDATRSSDEIVLNGLPAELGLRSGDSLYAKARGTFAGAEQLKEAASLGTRILRDDYDEMAELISEFTPSQREAFKGGAMKAIRDRLEMSTDWNDASRRLLPENIKKRLANAFDDDQQYQRFIGELEKEQAFRQTSNAITQNSQTALRHSAQEQINNSVKLPSVLDAAAESSVSNAGAVTRLIQRLLPSGVDDKTMKALADFALKKGLSEDEIRQLLSGPGTKLPTFNRRDLGYEVGAPIGLTLSDQH